MEFNEKLRELRKSRGLTQEELAEALYVSRTAISKWESGRGYPSIDSLKEISVFFSVSIDDLLSCEKVLCIAEKENRAHIQNICNLLLGISDLMAALLMILPLYPKTEEGFVYSVNLFDYTELTAFNRSVYWTALISLIALGAVQVILNQMKIKKDCGMMTNASFAIHVLTIVFLALTRQSYAVVIAFFLLLLKGVVMMKREGRQRSTKTDVL